MRGSILLPLIVRIEYAQLIHFEWREKRINLGLGF